MLTPEEWVRQHLLNYLVVVMKYPAELISVEKELRLNGLVKRYDVVVYKNMLPYLIVECKAPYIELSEMVIEQALRYNLIVKADFVMISNGVSDVVVDCNNQFTPLPPFN